MGEIGKLGSLGRFSIVGREGFESFEGFREREVGVRDISDRGVRECSPLACEFISGAWFRGRGRSGGVSSPSSRSLRGERGR